MKKSEQTAPPSKTIEGRENQLIALATNLAEQQLRDGTASSQVITHFLKLGTSLAQLEKEKLENENILLQAKSESLRAAQRSEIAYEEAINALKRYSGSDE